MPLLYILFVDVVAAGVLFSLVVFVVVAFVFVVPKLYVDCLRFRSQYSKKIERSMLRRLHFSPHRSEYC